MHDFCMFLDNWKVILFFLLLNLTSLIPSMQHCLLIDQQYYCCVHILDNATFIISTNSSNRSSRMTKAQGGGGSIREGIPYVVSFMHNPNVIG